MDSAGIYCIENVMNGRKYIGSSVDVERRFYFHCYELKKGTHANPYFQRAWSKYGEDSFTFEVLLFCDKKDLLFYEQSAVDTYQVVDPQFGYNMCLIAGNTLYKKHSEKTKRKIRKARAIQELEIGNPRLGTKHSAAAKRKMSEARKAFFASPESKKAKQAVAESNKRRECKAFRDKRTVGIRAFYADKERSREARKKISETSKRRYYEALESQTKEIRE